MIDKDLEWFRPSKIRQQMELFMTPNQTAFCCCASAAAFAAGFSLGRRPNAWWRRFVISHDIPQSFFENGNSRWLRGRVVSVSDGDTFRFRHSPTIFHSSRLPPDTKLSASTIPVRICTIDTPETAKFGKPGQPFGDEARLELSGLILNKVVKIRPLHRDQYGRVVAEVYRWPNTYLDVRMLKAGLAEVYQGGGAVYGRLGIDAYLDLQKKAQNKGKGMWSMAEKRESAADYKARTKD